VDLGIRGRTAIVCAASKGLGKACAMALAREGVALVITARGKEALERTAEEIRSETGASVTAVVGDIATEQGRMAAIEACPAPDILVNNAGGPPPGDFRQWGQGDWLAALEANMLAPIALIRSVLDGMIDRRFGRIVNITSGAVKAPISHLGLSNGARAGLTGFIAGLARQTAEHNVTINNLLPGAFATQRLSATYEKVAEDQKITIEKAQAGRLKTIPAARFGQPSEFGDACAFLCAAQSGYITGQNLLIDGGAYPGVL
jgi:3-oxoacyl-[acyl-carrier protein] reductase